MKYIAAVPGDPSGVGAEVLVKAIISKKCSVGAYVIPFFDTLTMQRLKEMFPSENFKKIFSAKELSDDFLCYFETDLEDMPYSNGNISLCALHQAADFCMETGSIMVTGPINKDNISKVTGKPSGHTEILAEYTKSESPETVFCLENLKVFFLSRHLSLFDALKKIKKEQIYKKVMQMHAYMKKLGFPNPKLAVAALNPHAGDSGHFGSEEINEIAPAIENARLAGIAVTGPLAADSVFAKGFEGYYDAILSLYHDQGHIALKTRDFYKTITMTLGLPFLRISIDHGTADDIAWKGIANPLSMESALSLAGEMNNNLQSLEKFL